MKHQIARNSVIGLCAAALRRARGYLNTARADLEDRADRVDALDQIAMARRELDAAENRIRSSMPRSQLAKVGAAASMLLLALLLFATPAPTWAQAYQLSISNGQRVERYAGQFQFLETAPEGGHIVFHVEQQLAQPELDPLFRDGFDPADLAGMPPLQLWTVVLDFGKTAIGRTSRCYGYTHFQPSNGPRAWLLCP